jgi:hypothetical protein
MRIRYGSGHARGSRFFNVDQHEPDSHSLRSLAAGDHAHPNRVLVCARRRCAGSKGEGDLRSIEVT